MARSSRRSSRSSPRKKRARLDWVVNEDCYGSTLAVANGGLFALPLVYPKGWMTYDASFGPTIPAYAFPDAKRQKCVAVVGDILYNPSTWAAGSVVRMIYRIVKKPMDFNTGDAIADAVYSLFDSAFANERFSWQVVQYDTFVLGATQREKVHVRATVNTTLEPDEGLYLMIENQSGTSQTINHQFFLRSLLVADE